jgi:hypothetical protein
VRPVPLTPGTHAQATSVMSPAPRAVWDRVLASDPRSLPSQGPAWLDAVCDSGRYGDASRLYETRDGHLLVLPLVRRVGVSGVIAADASLPFGWGPGGLVSEGGDLRPEDVRMVLAELSQRWSARLWLRPSPVTAAVWHEGAPSGVHTTAHMAQSVDLRGGFEHVLRARFTADARNRARRAERRGVVVQPGQLGEQLPVFHELYRKSVDRWARTSGRPLSLERWRAARQEPPEKLAAVSRRLGPACRTYVARVGGRPAAAIVVLLGEHGAAYWRGAMDEELGSSYANYLLHRTAIEDACEAGLSAYHMGDSAPGSTLARFKSRFGAEDLHYASYHIERLPISAGTQAARRTAGAALRRVARHA